MARRANRDSVDEAMHQWAMLRPELDVTPIAVLARITKIAARGLARQEAALGGTGLSAADFAAIIALRRRPPPFRMTQTDLARAVGVTQGTATARVDRLVARGMATRTVDGGDGRVHWVQLTGRGADLFDEVAPRHLAAQASLLAPLDRDQEQQLAELLGVVLGALESDVDADG